MRNYSKILAGIIVFISLHAKGTDTTTVKGKYNIVVGIDVRADSHCFFEMHAKYLNGWKSFALKGGYFNYDESKRLAVYVAPSPTPFRPTQVIFDHIYQEYNIRGFCLKPGWIFHHRLKKHLILSNAIYGIASFSEHEFGIYYPNGSTIYLKKDIRLGAEYEFLIGFRFLDNFLLSSSFQLGFKPNPVYLFKNEVDNFPSYKEYSPVQGRSKGNVYINPCIGLSFVF